MNNIYKTSKNPELLCNIQNSVIGKNVEGVIGLSANAILENCILDEPEENIPGFYGLMSWESSRVTIEPTNIYDAQMLLKQAWILNPKNRPENPLYGAIIQEITKYETQLLCEASQKALKNNQEILKKHEKNLASCTGELKNNKQSLKVLQKNFEKGEEALKKCQFKLKKHHKKLKDTQEELLIRNKEFCECKEKLSSKQIEAQNYKLKIEESRQKKVKSAKMKRPWKALDNWILKKLKKRKHFYKELWSLLPEKQENFAFYRKDDKIFCAKNTRKPIKIRAFYDHVRKVKEKIMSG